MVLNIRIPILVLIVLSIILLSCKDQVVTNKEETGELSMSYFLNNPPSDTPLLFAPGIISTQYHEHSFPAISPDGNMILWTSGFYNNYIYSFRYRILITEKNNATWQDSEYFSSINIEESYCPCFSPQGDKIFFGGDTATLRKNKNADIWYVSKTDDGWSEPQPVPGKINSEKLELQVSVTNDETLYFISHLEGVKNNYGIYRSRLIDEEYQEPVALPGSINSKEVDWTPFIAPDESYILFSSLREGGYGRGDLWISYRDSLDNWSDPINLGPTVNEEYNERFPYISPDGKYLFFLTDKVNPELLAEKELTYQEAKEYFHSHGNGQCDIYWVKADFINDLNPNK